ncbi:hypothetical protein PVAP13_5NG648600 [Panicum virgatum]|uniref:Uncharacterized protein n=1 Tax=Panicum virgatum TaxID=38727 RepID=A0A8T0S8I0_PANVG|nr:hypothetical protein PVAP13_5NG648600 [Panicum virgatum]
MWLPLREALPSQLGAGAQLRVCEARADGLAAACGRSLAPVCGSAYAKHRQKGRQRPAGAARRQLAAPPPRGACERARSGLRLRHCKAWAEGQAEAAGASNQTLTSSTPATLRHHGWHAHHARPRIH